MAVLNTKKSKRARQKLKKKVRRCSLAGKIMFKNRDDAEAKMQFLRELYAGGLRQLPIRVYRCPTCKYWHMTSRKGGSRKQKE